MTNRLTDVQATHLRDIAQTCRNGWDPEEWDPDDVDALVDLTPAAVDEIDQLRKERDEARRELDAIAEALAQLDTNPPTAYDDLDHEGDLAGWLRAFVEALTVELDDIRREAVRENARNVQATAERDHISEGNVKLRRERDAALDERDRLRELIDIADQEAPDA